MDQVKPWQIGLFIAAILVVIVSLWWTLGRTTPASRLADVMIFVDAETGSLYAFPVGGGKAVMPPEKNPDTGKVSLVPVYKDDSGVWLMPDRYDETLKILDVENKVIDPATRRVSVASEKAKRVSRK